MMMAQKQLVFLISLPRSGSTLIQRILTVHPHIHSVSEPWILLPFGYFLRPGAMAAEYSHATYLYAMEDFLKVLKGGREDFLEAVRRYSTYLYSRTQNGEGARYFLDKTPRYFLIIDFLAAAFPEAKFIFLFRNPVEVFASILTTWYGGAFSFYPNYVDIYSGPAALAKGFTALGNRALAVQYEELTLRPAETTRAICRYLDIDYLPAMLEDYRAVRLEGRMGDPKEAKEYSTISTVPLKKWKSTLNTRYRRWFIKKYVQYLGDEVLLPFNTSVASLAGEIDSIVDLRPGSMRDLLDHAGMLKAILFCGDHFSRTLKAIVKNRPVVPLR